MWHTSCGANYWFSIVNVDTSWWAKRESAVVGFPLFLIFKLVKQPIWQRLSRCILQLYTSIISTTQSGFCLHVQPSLVSFRWENVTFPVASLSAHGWSSMLQSYVTFDCVRQSMEHEYPHTVQGVSWGVRWNEHPKINSSSSVLFEADTIPLDYHG